MPRNYDRIDLDFSVIKGDFQPGEDGDILDTKDDQIEALRQRVGDIIRSEIGDWEHQPYAGAGLSEFLGKANSRELARKMERQISFAVVNYAGVADQDVSVKIVPLDRETVMVMIAIQAMPTVNNSLATTYSRFKFTYSFGSTGVRL